MYGGTTILNRSAFFCFDFFIFPAIHTTMRTFLALCYIFTFNSVSAQDYHQWSEHFGARASLLGGAATSGLGDNATAFYNSAAMAFVDDPSLSISVNAY